MASLGLRERLEASGQGLSKYFPLLEAAGLMEAGRGGNSALTDAQLLEAGVSALGARRKILAVAAAAGGCSSSCSGAVTTHLVRMS